MRKTKSCQSQKKRLKQMFKQLLRYNSKKNLPQKQEENEQQNRPGKLVSHKLKQRIAIILKQSVTHCDYYFVLRDGHTEEWHISNIKNCD
jgi:hypothetical protein